MNLPPLDDVERRDENNCHVSRLLFEFYRDLHLVFKDSEKLVRGSVVPDRE